MSDLVQPKLAVGRITEVDCAALAARGIDGVILDLDNTLTPWHSCDVSPGVRAWVAGAKAAGLRLCLVTNAATNNRVRPVAELLDIPWVVRAVKPLPFGYRRAMATMGTTPATTAVIGDQMLTDIFGGNRLGLFTILVDPITMREALVTRLIQRPLERLLGRRLPAQPLAQERE